MSLIVISAKCVNCINGVIGDRRQWVVSFDCPDGWLLFAPLIVSGEPFQPFLFLPYIVMTSIFNVYDNFADSFHWYVHQNNQIPFSILRLACREHGVSVDDYLKQSRVKKRLDADAVLDWLGY